LLLLDEIAAVIEIVGVRWHFQSSPGCPNRYFLVGKLEAGIKTAGERPEISCAPAGAPRPTTFSDDGRSPGSRVSLCCLSSRCDSTSDASLRQQLTAYSCGGSPGFAVAEIKTHANAPKFPLSPKMLIF
jgi:hypothetical protein